MISIGILGTSSIAKKSIIPALLNLTHLFKIDGIASRSIENARIYASTFNINYFGTYEELLNLKDLDSVYIPLPNSLHAQWVEFALQRNLHVLVEKSLGCNYLEVQNLTNIANKNDLVLLENFQFRKHTQLAVIKQLVDEGEIGDLRCLRSSFGFPPFEDVNNIRYKKQLGGGALLDAGAYPIKLASFFLGNELKVTSAKLSYDIEKEVDIWGGGFLEQTEGDLFAEIAFGFDNFYQCNVELWGSKGKISTNRIFTAPPNYSPEIIIETTKGKKTITVAPENHFEKMLKYFSDLIGDYRLAKEEAKNNLIQANLIEQFKNIANA